MISEFLNNKQGKLQKILIILIITFLILLISFGINTAQEEDTSESNEDPLIEEEVEDPPVEEEIEDQPTEEEIIIEPIKEISTEPEEIIEEENVTAPVEEILEELNETIVEELPLDEILNETSETSNETTNDTQPLPKPEELPEEEIISDSPSSGEAPGIIPEPELSIQISNLTEVTRGEVIEISATIINSGAKAKNVLAIWVLPEDFEIISGNEIENCGDLGKEESCISTINVQTSILSSLGKNQIKIRVGYGK
ncbi:hypothetical protein CMI40_01015 [Candidatus Pacearchaeota archaeon]|jgi:hypothetical protein|nr:hypothetical protein [Candidatus Pacearchaeota archaeon]|tara:strand:- start:3358 stop:4122 length:765 start_codon:yes stop_codon:yes gene_type:complete